MSLRRRAKCFIVGGAIIVLFLFAYGALFAYKASHNRAAEQMIRVVIPACEEYRVRFGKYPETLDQLTEHGRVAKKVLGVFRSPKLFYRSVDGGYRIWFGLFPLGPFHGYNSKSGEWFYEE